MNFIFRTKKWRDEEEEEEWKKCESCLRTRVFPLLEHKFSRRESKREKFFFGEYF
jgi:hypothetical protein